MVSESTPDEGGSGGAPHHEERRDSGDGIAGPSGGTPRPIRVGLGTGGGSGPSVCDMTIEALLTSQAGVITRSQALAAGLSGTEVDRLVRLRRWFPLHPRVYLAGGYPHDPEVDVRAAALWAGDGSVLDGVAAAWWWGLRTEVPPVVGLTVPRHRPGRSRPGVAVRRRDLAAADVATRRGAAVTGLPLTVLDTAVDLGADGPAFLDRALRERVPFPDVLAAHRRTAATPGAATAGWLLAGSADRATRAAVEVLVRLLRAGGVGGWRAEGDAVVFPRSRVAVEVHGWATLRGPAPRPGWVVLRLSRDDTIHRPRDVLARLLAALDPARARRDVAAGA